MAARNPRCERGVGATLAANNHQSRLQRERNGFALLTKAGQWATPLLWLAKTKTRSRQMTPTDKDIVPRADPILKGQIILGSVCVLVAAKNRGYLARKDGGEWLTVEVDKKGAD